MHLEFLDDDRVVHRVPLLGGALTVGRSSSNDVILRHPGISGHHARISLEANGLVVQDLGSTNGSFLDGERFYGQVEVEPSARVRFGTRIEMRATSRPEVRQQWILSQVDGPVAIPVDRDPLPVPDSDWSIQGTPPSLYGPDGGRVSIGVEAAFDVAGVAWMLVPAGGTVETARIQSNSSPYDLFVDLHRPMAVLSHGSIEVKVSSALGVALFHVLGSRWLEDPADGWCDHETVGSGVWGRAWRDQGPNNLNVLIHRLKKRAVDAGLERPFLERRPLETRLMVRSVRLASG